MEISVLTIFEVQEHNMRGVSLQFYYDSMQFLCISLTNEP